MIRKSVLLLLGGILVASTGIAQQSSKPDLRAIAHQLIAGAMLQEGQSVFITGSLRDAGLMEDLAIEARKVGAQPLLAIWSERLVRRSYDEVPAKYDDQEPKLDLAVAKLFDAQIAIDFGESEGLLAGVPEGRIAARAKAFAPVNEAFLKRDVHFVNLGNGLYPTATLAKRLGIPQARLAAAARHVRQRGHRTAHPSERDQPDVRRQRPHADDQQRRPDANAGRAGRGRAAHLAPGRRVSARRRAGQCRRQDRDRQGAVARQDDPGPHPRIQ